MTKVDWLPWSCASGTNLLCCSCVYLHVQSDINLWGVSLLFLFLPQISPHDRPLCGSGRPGVVAEKVPAARSSTSEQGLSYIWARSGTQPLQVAGRETALVEGPQEPLGPSLALEGYGEWMMDGERWERQREREREREQRARSVWLIIQWKSTFNRCSEHFPVFHFDADLCKESKRICSIGDFPPP